MSTSTPTSTRLLVRRFEDVDADAWDRFVDESANGTFMHTRRFLSYHPPQRFHDHSLLFLDESQKLRAVFTAAEVLDKGRRILKSHPGATYGGLVVDGSLSSSLAQY